MRSCTGWVDGLPHDAVVLSLGPLVREAGPFEEAAAGAVKKRCRGLLAAGVLRIGLHHAAARVGDQREGPVEGHRGHALPAVALVHEEAGEAVVPAHPASGLDLLAGVHVRELRRSPVLAPAAGYL